MVIECSRRARTDARDLKAYIAKDSPYYARRFIERIVASVETLAEFPKTGRAVPEGPDDVRELIYHIYLTWSERAFVMTIINRSGSPGNES